MKKPMISWLLVIMFGQAAAFVACESTTSKARGSELAVDSINRGRSFNVEKPTVDHDQRHKITGGVNAVIHEKRGANGGADIVKKPTKTKSAASGLPVTLGHITFCVFMAANYFILLQ
ncbi:uncharacterized protein LOC105166328 isoform X2 [Sesamum indicum]|uniref:Uncharacterized protein LOC105166328 isoform X2 n=1 Tax=Sesamum indicum TaxID=4182 RepID=A0A6I9TFI4_SESIN|nr:uncharacterized protein LOC105166328 isoform X2 [Sesamum indicum]